jgi:hypothetical protein
MRRRKTAFVACAAGVAAVASCQDPTEFTLHFTTSAKCADFGGTAIAVGPDPSRTDAQFFDERFATASTPAARCDKTGLIGTLVVTPGDNKGAVVVAAAVRGHDGNLASATACQDPAVAASDACIIARRSFTFTSHRSLDLTIDLDPRCAGRSCEPGSTCYQGACVDETVSCDSNGCGLVAQGYGQGGGTDASTTDGMYEDVAAMGDASTLMEGGGVTDGSGALDGSDGSVVTGTDGSSVTDASSLPQCGTAMMQGPSWSASCDIAGGTGVLQPFHSMPAYQVCSCQCVDLGGNNHGRGQCVPMQPDPCTAQCGF